MNGWWRYPGRIAHRASRVAEPILDVPDETGHRKLIGREIETVCFRRLRTYWSRPWSATSVPDDELREENPRGWCLRCAYWTAREALILPPMTISEFADLVLAGRYRLV